MTEENSADVQRRSYRPVDSPLAAKQHGEIVRRIAINDQKKLAMDPVEMGRLGQDPDPSIRTIEHHDIHIFWVNADDSVMYTTDQTSMLQDNMFMCMPGVAIQEGQTVILNDSADFKFFDKVSETVNYYRKLNQKRPEAIAWTIPLDCPVGDEIVSNCYLPWDAATLSRDPGLLDSDDWPTDQQLHPYCVMALGAGEPWLRHFTFRALKFYATLGKIQIVTDRDTGMLTVTEIPDENRRQSICGGEGQVSLPESTEPTV